MWHFMVAYWFDWRQILSFGKAFLLPLKWANDLFYDPATIRFSAVLTPFLFLIPPYLAVVYFGNRVGYAIAALAIAAYLVPAWLHNPHWYLNPLSAFLAIAFSFALVFVVLIARVVSLEKAGRVREQGSRIGAEESLA